MDLIVEGLADDTVHRPCAPSLLDLAGTVAAHARPLLVASHAVLVSLTITTRSDRKAAVASCWAGAPQPVPLRPRLVPLGKGLARSLAAFEDNGQRLLKMLMLRWPANAIPPVMGIVTDGDGVIFSSDHPSPLYPDWLALHQAGACAPTTLVAFSRDGAWARLTDPIAQRRLH